MIPGSSSLSTGLFGCQIYHLINFNQVIVLHFLADTHAVYAADF